MENAGMKREALHRKAFWARVDKEWVDGVWYAILAEDYLEKKHKLVGKKATVTTIVTESNTAKTVGSGNLDVFATPMMIALMENAACKCIADILREEQTSVGTHISVDHMAASPINSKISATAEIEFVSGREIVFNVTASDESNKIGRGKHTRCVIDKKRFIDRLNKQNLHKV
jgi:predicted thioesterase